MYRPDTSVGCPFWYDGIPENLRQCQKPLGHGGGHQWNGPNGFYVKWAEKLASVASDSSHSNALQDGQEKSG